ncbi:MAG: TerB family tellurite resistance protein [Jaaginema sp. PMC 1079.18]|nr:TerB family tellurite resistance protein [Jaaginema sp. PMC 1080.18]MEC4852777.1 TerB family tellurite resistance protein [Jaaginema sp. PMC 1079.18]MEC4867421.1 TerB family tellurite resistance protein [Jaaginema sp. PMC 1078.18]
MKKPNKTKQLFKILMGVAWIDGVIQAEERQYLQQMARDRDLADDPEIQTLLSEIKPVTASECYGWLENYLGENHNTQDYQELLEALSALVYSDGEVDTREAQLLAKVQLLDPALDPHQSPMEKLLAAIQVLYRQAIREQ